MNKRNDFIAFSSVEFNKLGADEKILQMVSDFNPPEGLDEKIALELVLNRINNTPEIKTFRLKPFLLVAAAVLLLITGIPAVFVLNSVQKQVTSTGQHAGLSLPDGTIVTINANSKITWRKKNFASNRMLNLTGEAFFDVRKGSKFEIKTQYGKVEILGTQLNVFAREKEFRVSCISGKVKVTANGIEQILTPGEETILLENELVKKNFNSNLANLWKEGIFYFEDRSLITIFDELERQFGVSVKFNGNMNRNATVSFSNKSLKEALDVICLPLELSYEIKKENKIFITDKK